MLIHLPVEIVRHDEGEIEGAVLSVNDFRLRVLRAGDRKIVTIAAETVIGRYAAGWRMEFADRLI